MKAIRVHEFGPPAERLQIVERPDLHAGQGEVLIRLSAASVNPSDVKNVQGFMHQTTLPRTPGRDFAGTVIEGPANWVGAEVWGTGGDLGFTRDGSHAEYLVVPASAVVPRPAGLSAEAAACCGVTFVTAAYGLAEAGFGPNQTVVIIGALGGVGRAASQIALHGGATVIGIVRGDPPADLPRNLSAVKFINSSRQDVAAEIKNLTGGADIVYDAVGGPMLLDGLKYLAPRGHIVEISAGRDPHVTIDLREFYHQQARLIGVDSLSLDAAACAAILRPFADAFDSGEFSPPPIAARYALSDAIKAYTAVASGSGEGRHVLVMR